MFLPDKWWASVILGIGGIYLCIETILFKEHHFIGISFGAWLLSKTQSSVGTWGVLLLLAATSIFLIKIGIIEYKNLKSNN